MERCSHRSTDEKRCRRGRWRRPRRRRCRREPPPGGGGGRERARRCPSGSTAPLRLRGNLREASLAAEVGEDLRQAPEPPQHAPPFLAAPAARLGPSARRQAEAPESCPVAPESDQRSTRARGRSTFHVCTHGRNCSGRTVVAARGRRRSAHLACPCRPSCTRPQCTTTIHPRPRAGRICSA